MARPEPARTELSDPFWEAAQQGRMTLQRCDECATQIFPPRVVCPECWSSDLSWIDSSGRGEIYAFSIVHRAPNEAFADLVPYAVALITLDEGPRMMTNIVDCEPDAVAVGMRVQVAFPSDGFPLPLFRPESLS